MKIGLWAAALAVVAFSSGAAAANDDKSSHPDVVYHVVLLRNGEKVASPTAAGRFGQEVRVELPKLMRVSMASKAPNSEALSFTSATMSIFQNGEWRPEKKMSMMASLTQTPSFEYDVEGTPYRFIVMPRAVAEASSQ